MIPSIYLQYFIVKDADHTNYPLTKAEPLGPTCLSRISNCQMYRELTSKHTGMRAVQHNEFCHHFRIMNRTEPGDDATPVMPHKKTSVVS